LRPCKRKRLDELAARTGTANAHLETRLQQQVEAGMRVDEARQAALRRFGNPTLAAENSHAAWGWRWLEELTQDAGYGLRLLPRNPFLALAYIPLPKGRASRSIWVMGSSVGFGRLSMQGKRRHARSVCSGDETGCSTNIRNQPDVFRRLHSLCRLARTIDVGQEKQPTQRLRFSVPGGPVQCWLRFQYKYPGTPSSTIVVPQKASVGRVRIVFRVHAAPINT
jgi:hypothetical protein